MIDSVWEDQNRKSYNASVTVTNTGASDIESWALQYCFPDELVSIWNASYERNEEQIVVSAGKGNVNIAPGQTITYGFQAVCAAGQMPAQPENVTLLGVRENTPQTDYEVIAKLQSQWNTGSVYEVTIRNVSGRRIKGWEVSFSLDAAIINVWNGTLTGDFENGYSVKCMDYNSWIEPEMTVSFGFQTQYDKEGITGTLQINEMTEILSETAEIKAEEPEENLDELRRWNRTMMNMDAPSVKEAVQNVEEPVTVAILDSGERVIIMSS